MTEKTAEKILAKLDEAAKMFDYPDFSNGIDMCCRYFEEQSVFLEPIRTREGLREIFLDAEEPSTSDLTLLLTALRTLPFLFRKLLPTLAKEMPHDPGGHPASLSQDAKKEVCVEVGKLVGLGVKLKDAQDRLAKRKGVSLRTIQRAWQERSALNKFLETEDEQV